MDASEVWDLIDFMTKHKPPGAKEHMNILLFGRMGAGKSSLLNTIFSSLSDKIETRARSKATVDKSITPNLNILQLTKYILLYDVWGWSDNNYSKGEFEFLLKGRLPNRFLEGKDPSVECLTTEQGSIFSVDCIIFLVPIKSHDNDQYIQRLQNFIKRAEDLGKRYVVALSQIDTKFRDLREQPSLIYSDDRVNKIKVELATTLGVEPRLVFPSLSYFSEDSKVEYIDITALRILKEAIVLGESEVKNDLPF